jgi:hypothetical protein
MANTTEVKSVWSTTGDYRVAENVLLQWLKWRYRSYGEAVTNSIVVQVSQYQHMLFILRWLTSEI